MNTTKQITSIWTGAMVTTGILALTTALASAQITYVDAAEGAAGNTYEVGGSLDNTSWIITEGAGGAAHETMWQKRTGASFVNGGNALQAIHAVPPNTLPVLITQITGLTPGTYHMWAFFSNGNDDWGLAAGFSADSLTTYYSTGSYDAYSALTNVAEATKADTLSFSNSVVLAGSDFSLWACDLGTMSVDDSGVANVFLHNEIGGQTGHTRTWYDGIGYEHIMPGTLIYGK